MLVRNLTLKKYNKRLLILASTFTVCVSVSAFASLVDVSVGITSSAFGLKICVINARLKKSMSIIKKKIQKT